MPRYKNKQIQAEFEHLQFQAHNMDRLGQSDTSHHENLRNFVKLHARKAQSKPNKDQAVISPQEKQND